MSVKLLNLIIKNILKNNYYHNNKHTLKQIKNSLIVNKLKKKTPERTHLKVHQMRRGGDATYKVNSF